MTRAYFLLLNIQFPILSLTLFSSMYCRLVVLPSPPYSILKYLPKNSLACLRKPDLPSISDGVIKSNEGFEPPVDILETPCEGDTIASDGTVSMNNPSAFALEVPEGQGGVLSDYDLLLTDVCQGNSISGDYITVHVYGAARGGSLFCESVMTIYCNEDTPSTLQVLLEDSSNILVIDGFFDTEMGLSLDLRDKDIGISGQADDTLITNTPTITPNGIPDAKDDSVTTNEDSPTSSYVFSNDLDPDGNPLTVISLNGELNIGNRIINLPSGATVQIDPDTGYYIYDPNDAFDYLDPGETVMDIFTYTVSDGQDGTDMATVTVVVEGAAEPTAGCVFNYYIDEPFLFTCIASISQFSHAACVFSLFLVSRYVNQNIYCTDQPRHRGQDLPRGELLFPFSFYSTSLVGTLLVQFFFRH